VIYHDEYSEFLGGVLNFAISIAKEKYIFRMDSDDIWLKGRFKLQSTYILQNPDVDILSGSLEIINKDGMHLYNIVRNLTPIEFYSKLKYACVIAHPTVLFKKSSVLKHGGYSLKLAATEDFDLWARMRKGSKIIGLPDLVIKHRLHSESVSAKKTQVQLNENLHIVARENLALTKFFSIDCSKYQHKYRSKFLYKTFFQYFKLKRKFFIIIKKYENLTLKKFLK
jgi:glycosyltransferase involved in cell wall biosynthesis